MTWEKQKKMISSSWGCLFFLTFLASQKYETDVFAHLDNKVQLQKGRFTFISVAKNFFTVQMGKQRGKISALHMHFSALMALLGERGGEESVILLLSSLYPPVSLPLKWTTWSPGSVLRVPTGRNQELQLTAPHSATGAHNRLILLFLLSHVLLHNSQSLKCCRDKALSTRDLRLTSQGLFGKQGLLRLW